MSSGVSVPKHTERCTEGLSKAPKQFLPNSFRARFLTVPRLPVGVRNLDVFKKSN